ncbi:hypothetical protein IU404_02210 [Limosilactobacillus reuteri]|uniref:peptidase n=1 Tax=Limosilactobacillus reuteri TaxID=1598 RepID=UPI001E405BF7|nr:peptidase [Limosilactobacillus reuteri]UFK66744.1 hypothetical protein IU404_02210 [Limosilactobacillus reuteri]
MLTQSKETRDAWRASQRTLDIKVTIDGKTYGATDINSLKYDSGAYNGDTFAIGSTYSNTVQIEFSHLIEGLKLGMEVHPSIGIKTSSGYVYEPLGVFIISSEIKMDRNNNLTTVSASDRFCGLEGTYVSKLTYPAKVLDVIAEICAQSGVKANTDDLARLPHQADLSAPITGQSYRKALGWIAQLYVGYALFDRQGLFTIRTISEPNYELDPSQYEQAGLTKNEAAYKINGIQCQVTITTKTRDGESTEETKNYQAGDATGSQIKLENNIMTPQRLNDIWEQLKDITFYPFSLNWFGNPAVEAGDWLRLEDKQGNSFVVPNSSYTLDFNGGLSATSKADQTTSSDQMVSWQGSVTQTIKELQLRRLPDGTVVFPPSVTAPPTNAKFNDVWFKKNGNSTELWIFEKQDDGSGKWIRKDLSDDEIKKKVADAQQGLNQAKADIINNKQKADADVENLNKSIEDNKKIADESLQKLNDSVTNLQGQYDNNIVPDLTKVTNDVADALQKYISAQNSIADLTKQAQQQGKDIADVSNTVKGLNINYANLAGDVNTTKIDVKGLQTTLGTANGDINQLKIDAQHMQGLLAGKVDNSTYTNFVNLTNQALAAKLTASDLNGYAKTVDVEATANGLRVDMNSVTDRLNNLKIGGRNLVPGTSNNWTKVDNSWGPNWPLDPSKWSVGDALTISAEVRNGSGTIQVGFYDRVNGTDNTAWGGKSIPAGGHGYLSFTYKVREGTTIVRPTIWTNPQPGAFEYRNLMVEKSSTPSNWVPAPEDTEHSLTELSSRINATSQQFSSYYTKSETDNRTNSAKNDAINTIRNDGNWQGLSNILTNSGFLQTADGFLQKVQQTTIPMFSGGGVNLLTGTADFSGDNWDRDGRLSLSDNLQKDSSGNKFFITNYAWTQYMAKKHLEPGTYTFSWNAKGDAEGPMQVIVQRQKDNSAIVNIETENYGTIWKRYSYPFTLNQTEDVKIFVTQPNVKPNFSVGSYKLERGSVATPWSPAPSDNTIAFAELSQSLEGLRSTVSGNYGQLQTQISQSASAVRTELNDRINGVDNKTTSTANSLNSVIGRVGSLEHLTNVQVVNNAINANDYTNTGNYFIQSTDNINVPGTNWCYLKVERVNDGRIVQTWQADSDPTLRYVRTKFSDSWTQWQRSASYSEYSELNRTLQGLQSTVSSNHSDLQSQISQTAKAIRQEVSDKTGGLQTQINQQANNFNVSLNSLRKETAWQKVTSAIDANNYKTTGNYWIQAVPNSNTPDSSAWAYLQVVAYPDVKRIKQTWQRDNNENEIYTRLLIGDNWTSWQRTVTGGNIMAQINMSAGTTLIQNDKIYMDASSTIFSGKAFIPDAAITNISADKITAGTLDAGRINVINLNANNITAGTLRGSNGEFYLDSGALHVWQGDHNAWIDKNGIHDYDNQGNNVWISRGSISAYGNSSGAYLFDGGLYLHKSQSLSDAVLDPDYGSITKSDNIVFFGTSGLDIEGKDGFLLRTHGWNDQTLSYLNGNEIIGAGIAGKSDGFINIAAKKQLFLYAGEPIQNNNLKTIPNLVLDGTYQNGQTVLKGTFSQYFFQGPSSGFSGGITLQDEFVNVGSLNGKNYFSINSDGAINITANGKSILSLNGLFPGVNSDFNVSGNFTVTGSKNAVVPTSRGMAAINAYETAEYYFGDIGETQTNSNGVVTVMIDPYFLETVNTLVPYQVFLTPYGNGNVWVSSRSANNFTVKSSNPNIHFAWEIKAKRKGYENDRMKIVKGVFNNEQY